MFDQANEPSFRLDVAGLSDPFEVLAFTGSEALSEPFAFEIDVLIDDPQLDLADLLYRSAFLCFGASGEGVHGQLQSLVQHEHGHGSRLCRIRLGPKLGCLELRISQRIFSGCSVPQIIEQVLREHGIIGAQRRFELHGDYPVRTFCTQYRESDLQLLQRLCAQARIHYFFEHGPDRHCLVFGDDPTQLPLAGTVLYRDEPDSHNVSPGVRHWQFQETLQSAPSDARPAHSAEGCSHLAALRSGYWLRLAGHPFAECNRHWLLTRIEHSADPSLDRPYANRLFATLQLPSCLPATLPTRLRMHSLQRAWVVTVDEPQPDCFRPVAVQFDWLYQGEGAAPSHCWLPLAPALVDAPLVALSEGVEVVVSFFEGDPDQPMISGVLQPSVAGADIRDEPPLPDRLVSQGLQQLLTSGEPLLLLCLIPGGGSFSHCAQAVCSCRLVTKLEQSGAT
ncbi:type VI secretion protein [Pseudomonas sp. 43A]|jgi:type VI secretion system secreted protein VgrG|uniref:type VI secretion system Vgr family protein n=1 Tax=Pseudomonas TaxID=286 RepID=UPI0003046588|nr:MULTISPECIES: contractile injection system protein, VgrG/Pvc8 family [Pseudomonas]QKV62150.1 type VI secretion protein [Pseudomonas sp. 43A]QMW10886.1 type VI secretion protein [Pseudomonas sp. 29A]